MRESLVKQLQEELRRVEIRFQAAEREHREADEDRKAIARTIRILTRGSGRDLGDDDLGVAPSAISHMTQEQAAVFIAERNNGSLPFSAAKRLLVQAGLIANPKNAASILYTVLNRSEHFAKVTRGEYRLTRPTEERLDAWGDPVPEDVRQNYVIDMRQNMPTLREVAR